MTSSFLHLSLWTRKSGIAMHLSLCSQPGKVQLSCRTGSWTKDSNWKTSPCLQSRHFVQQTSLNTHAFQNTLFQEKGTRMWLQGYFTVVLRLLSFQERQELPKLIVTSSSLKVSQRRRLITAMVFRGILFPSSPGTSFLRLLEVTLGSCSWKLLLDVRRQSTENLQGKQWTA